MQILAYLISYNIIEYKKIPLAVSKEESEVLILITISHLESVRGHFTSGRKATTGYVCGACPLTSLPHSLLRWWGGSAGAPVLLGPFQYCIEMDLINRTLRKSVL